MSSELARIINDRLAERGWSQRELARRSEIPPATVSKICGGATFARPENLTALARELGIPARVLLAAAATDAGYLPHDPNPDGTNILIAGIKSLPPERQREIEALVEAMLKD